MTKTDILLQLNFYLSTALLFLEFITLIFILGIFFDNIRNIIKSFFHGKVVEFYGSLEKALVYKITSISALTTILTLIYSEYLGVIPCALCWFERMCMYPIVLLGLLAIYKKDEKNILSYIFAFSFFGAIISIYHHVLQITAANNSNLPCPASGGDCSKMIVFEYGHITFPFMAFVIFVFFMTIILFVKKENTKHV